MATEKKTRKPSQYLVQMVASNIRRFREALGVSQERLAAISGLHRTYIGSVERGERNITLSTLEVLAEALEVEVTELISPPQ
jgi:transcriptional regulator with XRE-family HTH domain